MSEDERTYTIFHEDGPITLTETELCNEYMRLREQAEGDGMTTILDDRYRWERRAVAAEERAAQLEAERDEQRRIKVTYQDKFLAAEERVAAAEAERDEAIKRLEMIADADYRGNRSGESVAAYQFLRSIGRRT